MHVLRCRPTELDVLAKDKYGNEYMDPENRPDKARASLQSDRLSKTYEMIGVIEHFITAVLGLVDMTFTANSGFTFIGKDGKKYVILPNFRPERRRPETHYFETYYRHTLGYATINIPSDDIYFEGAGDAIPFGDIIFMGYGFRTSQNMAPELESITDKKVIPLELVKPKEGDKILYHLDTTMIVIDNPEERIVIAYPGAFTGDSWALLENAVREQNGKLIEAGYEDAASLALNAVVIPKKDIVIPHDTLSAETVNNALYERYRGGVVITSDAASDTLRDILKTCGYFPVTLPLGEFLKSGGGAFCLTKILCD